MDCIRRRVRFVVIYALLSFVMGCAGIRSYPRYPMRGDVTCRGTVAQNRNKIERVIESFMGTPYVWGGASQAGVDCSGLVVEVFQKALGVVLPHSTEELFQMGRCVKQNRLCYGDLVFFSDRHSESTHVGLYVGRDQFVHASKEKGVTVSGLNSSYFRQRYIGARRLIL